MGGEMAEAVPAGKARLARARIARHVPCGLPVEWVLSDPWRSGDVLALADGLPRGAGLILRHFGLEGRGRLADALVQRARQTGWALLIAADPELALAVGAAGVHWPQRLAGQSRRWAGRFGIMTASAHSLRALRELAALPVDAALVSTVFASGSPSAGEPMGPGRLCAMVRAAGAAGPFVYALGGVNGDTVGRVAGFAGWARVGVGVAAPGAL
jgi:thiamine-phosphate pyrophosphorylase